MDVNTAISQLTELQKKGLGLKKIATDIEISLLYKKDRSVGEIKSIEYEEKSGFIWLEGK